MKKETQKSLENIGTMIADMNDLNKVLGCKMKRIKELSESFFKLKKLSAEVGININSVSLQNFWFSSEDEYPPQKVLGIEIK